MNGLLYDALTYPFERLALGALRRNVCAPLSGRVIDVGIGTGADFPYYSRDALVTALEPDSRMLARAIRRRADSKATIELVADDDSYLDRLTAQSVDAVIFALVLCTVRDPLAALVRAHRVLKPTGTLAILEHVRSPGILGSFQDRAAPLWGAVADGCHLNRNTQETIAAAGFDTGAVEHQRVRGLVVDELIVGFARPKGSGAVLMETTAHEAHDGSIG